MEQIKIKILGYDTGTHHVLVQFEAEDNGVLLTSDTTNHDITNYMDLNFELLMKKLAIKGIQEIERKKKHRQLSEDVSLTTRLINSIDTEHVFNIDDLNILEDPFSDPEDPILIADNLEVIL